ncbi:hypothetical protein N658DRAFT_258668 [Parathielavia hyrcaniae]|uniref:Uncharacterized protein n=1 Tax=Parathielavia hyrcaniae TaxID=113614 RepID=A0AAN6PYQ8_9PEZI|nr:hypothetical protein N658DRAFT_258668 [Parathielavia hyrcaniae]
MGSGVPRRASPECNLGFTARPEMTDSAGPGKAIITPHDPERRPLLPRCCVRSRSSPRANSCHGGSSASLLCNPYTVFPSAPRAQDPIFQGMRAAPWSLLGPGSFSGFPTSRLGKRVLPSRQSSRCAVFNVSGGVYRYIRGRPKGSSQSPY